MSIRGSTLLSCSNILGSSSDYEDVLTYLGYEDVLTYLGDRFELLAHVLVQALVRKRCLLNQTTMQLR